MWKKKRSMCVNVWEKKIYLLVDAKQNKLLSNQPTNPNWLITVAWQQTNILLSQAEMIILIWWLQWTVCIYWHIMILIIFIIILEMIRKQRDQFA